MRNLSFAIGEEQEQGSIISLKNVGYRYGNGPEILRNVNLEVKRGECYFLTGNSGAGKTTLLSLLYLENQPTTGRIELFNKPIIYSDRDWISGIRKKIGVVFQDYELIPHLTVFENVALPLKILGKSDSYIQSNVSAFLHWIGLGEFMNVSPKTLSGGQKQRVAIARAVINKPDILVADEPTGNVDPDMAHKLISLFVQLNQKFKTTIILATHNNELIDKFKFDQLHLNKGHLELVKKQDFLKFGPNKVEEVKQKIEEYEDF